MSTIVVLGAGMVGAAIATDLAASHTVTVADRDADRLARLPLPTATADLTDPDDLGRVIAPADLVIGALPGFLGLEMLRMVIEAGKHIVDISFCPEDPHVLHDLACAKDVTAIVDCGVAPGMCNVFLGHHAARGPVQRYECLVGGLPVERRWPFHYKAPFSPADVIEEYVRPARLVVDGAVVTRPALSDPELVDFDGIGTLEAFDTDGLRSLIRSYPDIPHMRERTLRYPGHIELMRVFRESGFFDTTPIDVRGVSVAPRDLTARLLFEQWRLDDDDPELTVMRITIDDDGGRTTYSLHDVRDASGVSSMARTTGYTCAAAAQLFLDGRFTRRGVCPPEQLGADGLLEPMRAYLADRGVVYSQS